MWPFKRKQTEEPQGPTKYEKALARVEVLRRWRAVGEEFEYLGRRMVVVSHSRLEVWVDAELNLVPEVRARYADDRGQIHELVLSEAEVLALMDHPTDLGEWRRWEGTI